MHYITYVVFSYSFRCGQALESIIKGTRYIRNSTGRGEKIAELTQHSSIDFTKAFWATFEMDAIRVCTLFALC